MCSGCGLLQHHSSNDQHYEVQDRLGGRYKGHKSAKRYWLVLTLSRTLRLTIQDKYIPMHIFDRADTWDSASELQQRALQLKSGICTQADL